MAGSHTPPILEPAKHDLYAVASFVAALVVLHSSLALLSTWDTGAYPFAFQRISEPVSVIATITKQPVHIWYAAEQSPRTNIIAHLSRGDKKAERPPLAVTDSMQFGIHAALDSTNQTATPPLFAAILVAV